MILFCAHHRSISNSTRALAKRFSPNECTIRPEKSAFDRTRCISNPEIRSIRGKNDDTRANANFHISALLRKMYQNQRKSSLVFDTVCFRGRKSDRSIALLRLRLRVRKLSIYQYTRINVPAPFSTNHRWNRQRLETECSGPTSGRTTPEPPRLPRARFGAIDFFSQKRRQICCCS